MSILKRFAEMAERFGLKDFCPVCAEEDGLFRMDDGYVGRVYMAAPATGADARVQQALATMMELDFPAGTMMQWQNWNLPTQSDALSWWLTQQEETRAASPLASVFSSMTGEFFRKFGEAAPTSSGKFGGSRWLILAIKIPASAAIDKKTDELDVIESLLRTFVEGLKTAGLYFSGLDAQQYLTLVRRVEDPWRNAAAEYNEGLYINAQLQKFGDRVLLAHPSRLHFRSSDEDGRALRSSVSIVSISRWPKRMSLALMNYIIGDPAGLRSQITVPNIVSTCIKFPDRSAGANSVRMNAKVAAFNTMGMALRWMPKLAERADGFAILLRNIDVERQRVLGVATSIILIHRSPTVLDKARGVVIASLGSLGVAAGVETFIKLPAYWTHMPLWPSFDGVAKLDRHLTMATEQAVQTLPVFGDWRGTTAPYTESARAGSLYLTRRGEIATFNVFSPSHPNANFVVIAPPGSGKSFAAQGIVLDQLAAGNRVWVIDVGRSYLKLCAAVKGEFMTFTDTSGACLNPFSLVTNIEEDLPGLSAVLGTMCDPTGEMFTGENGALHRARLSEAIRSQWTAAGRNITPDSICTFLNQQEDEVSQRLGATLFEFSKQGPYGRWFNGVNNVQMNNQFTVLELQELKSRPHLQSVILQMLILQISQQLYLDEDGVRKMVLVDEALDLVSDRMTGEFFNEAYQKFRKYGASMALIAQDMVRLLESPVGNAVRSNAHTRFFLQQGSATVSLLKSKELLHMEPYAWEEMRSVHTHQGQYAELFVLVGESYGVLRMLVPPFLQKLFSSSPAERTSIFSAIERGEDVTRTIVEQMQAAIDRSAGKLPALNAPMTDEVVTSGL